MFGVFSQAASLVPKAIRRPLIWATIFSCALSLFDAALLILVGPIVASLMNGTQPVFAGISMDLTTLLVTAGLILVSKNVMFIAVSRWKYRLLFDLQTDLSARALVAVMTDKRATNRLDPGRKASYVVNEPLQSVLNVYAPGISLASEFTLILFMITSLLIVNPIETLAMFGTLTVLIGGFQFATRRWLQSSGVRRRDSDGRRHEIVRAVIDCEPEVRAHRWMGRVSELYSEPNATSSRMTSHKAFATEIIKNVVELAVLVGVGLLLFGILLIQPELATAAQLAPMLAVFGVAAYRLAPSFNRIMVNSQSIRFGISSLEVVHEMLTRGHVVSASLFSTAEGGEPPAASVDELDVDVGVLRNPAGMVLAKNRRFVLRRGDVLVVTGPSGIGKSSLMRALIDGADDITIRVNGTLIEGGLADFDRSLGVAGQRPLVLPDSLRNNVLPPRDRNRTPDDDGWVLQVLTGLADQHRGSVIERESIARNLDARLSLSTLSGGQGQRIALMRALLFGGQILILDEPTSALDSDSRDRFIELVRGAAPARITIIVSHDPELESLATQKLRLEEIFP